MAYISYFKLVKKIKTPILNYSLNFTFPSPIKLVLETSIGDEDKKQLGDLIFMVSSSWFRGFFV